LYYLINGDIKMGKGDIFVKGVEYMGDHAIHLYKLVKALPEDAVVIEIGTGAGVSTRIILKALGKKGHLHTIDHDNIEFKGQEFSKCTFHTGQDLDIMEEWDKTINMAFVDLTPGNDSAHYIQLLHYLTKFLTKEGFILIHGTQVHIDIVLGICLFVKNQKAFGYRNLQDRHGLGIVARNPKPIQESLK